MYSYFSLLPTIISAGSNALATSFTSSLVTDMASQMYKETDAKVMLAARVTRQSASMMVQQDEFTTDYFTDLISYVTLDANGKVKLITKTETVIEEGTE